MGALLAHHAGGLYQMRQEERRYYDELLDMLMKSQPYALSFLSSETVREQRVSRRPSPDTLARHVRVR